MNRLSEGQVIVGDILFDSGKLQKAIKLRVGAGGTAIGTTATPITLPPGILSAQALITDIFANVMTAAASQTLSFGTTATPTGFAVGLSVGTSGLVLPGVVSATSGANGAFLISNTYGSLLATFTSGSTGTGSLGDCGLFVKRGYRSDSNASRGLSFTPSSSALGGTTLAVDVYVVYTDLTV